MLPLAVLNYQIRVMAFSPRGRGGRLPPLGARALLAFVGMLSRRPRPSAAIGALDLCPANNDLAGRKYPKHKNIYLQIQLNKFNQMYPNLKHAFFSNIGIKEKKTFVEFVKNKQTTLEVKKLC